MASVDFNGRLSNTKRRQQMLDDNNWMKWYNRLKEDRIRRRLGFLREDEGMMAPEDRAELLMKRGLGPREPLTEDSLRRSLGLARSRKEENKE